MKDYRYKTYHVIEMLSGGFAVEKDGVTITPWQPTSRAAEEVIESLVN